MNPTPQPGAAVTAQNSDAYKRTYQACQAGGMNNTDSHEMAMDHATRAAGEAAHELNHALNSEIDRRDSKSPFAQAHTPTPWRIEGHGVYRGDRCVAIICLPRGITPAQATANAALIVRACNSHAALVSFAKKVLAHDKLAGGFFLSEDLEREGREVLGLENAEEASQ